MRASVHNNAVNIPAFGIRVLKGYMGSYTNLWKWPGMLIVVRLHLVLVLQSPCLGVLKRSLSLWSKCPTMGRYGVLGRVTKELSDRGHTVFP